MSNWGKGGCREGKSNGPAEPGAVGRCYGEVDCDHGGHSTSQAVPT